MGKHVSCLKLTFKLTGLGLSNNKPTVALILKSLNEDPQDCCYRKRIGKKFLLFLGGRIFTRTLLNFR